MMLQLDDRDHRLHVHSTLSWPRVLVFESKATGPDPRDKESALVRRTLNVQIVYPPSLVAHFQIRLSDWGASASSADGNGASLHAPLHPYSQSQLSSSNFCPLYRLKAPDDLFACKTPIDDTYGGTEFRLPAAFDEILTKSGLVNAEVQSPFPNRHAC